MKSGDLKSSAKGKLQGVYLNAVLGMLVCYIPVYIYSLVTTLLISGGAMPITVLTVAVLLEIFVTDIFSVGYIRSLLDLNRQTDDRHYDVNLVLSGYGQNFKNTLKLMFLRRLYVFGWGCLMLLPITIAVIAVYVAIIAQDGMTFIQQIIDFSANPTETGMAALVIYAVEHFGHLSFVILGGGVASLLLAIPYIRKTYLYEMIPMIVAETPNISAKDAFAKTTEIMTGYRFRYFLLVLSFIWILLLLSIITIIPLNIAQYIAMALVMPYINMTLVQFYLWRTATGKEERNDENEN